jgi:hypothetical protein
MRSGLEQVDDRIDKMEKRKYLTDEQKVKLEDLRENAERIKDKISELEGKKYLTDAQKEQLEGLKTDLGETETAIDETAKAHDEATNRILFNILTERAAIDGLTEAEYNALVKVAEGMGLIDPATATAMRAADEFFSSFKQDTDLSTQKVQGLIDKMKGIPTSINTVYTVTVKYKGAKLYKEEGESGAPVIVPGPELPEPGLVPGGARGLHGFVPPGYPGDSYLIGASSGERVDIGLQAPAFPSDSLRGSRYYEGDTFNVFNFNRQAAAMSMAQLALVRKRRLNDSMGG